MTALGATIGTGNIAGVATAIIRGGPGHTLWIWCYGTVAMAIKFAEAVLGSKYRIPAGEHTLSGPMYYLRNALGSPSLAWIYALIAGVACLLTTPFTQPNSIAVAVDSQLKAHELDLGTLDLGTLSTNEAAGPANAANAANGTLTIDRNGSPSAASSRCSPGW